MNKEFFNLKGLLLVMNEAKRTASLYLYDVIGWDVVGAQVVQAIAAMDVDQIDVHINSPGGLVFDGFAIYNALNNHKANVVTHIDALAASIASVIAMAGDEINMAENAMFMIHNPAAYVGGTAEELRKQATVLDDLRTMIVAIYAARTGLPKEDIGAMMDAETWLNSTKSLEMKFSTAISSKLKAAACANFDIVNFKFKNSPKDTEFPKLSLPTMATEQPALPDLSHKRRRLALAEL